MNLTTTHSLWLAPLCLLLGIGLAHTYEVVRRKDFPSITLGSRIIGMLFEHVGGAKAFYFMIIPISLLIIALWLLNKFIKDYENAHQQA